MPKQGHGRSNLEKIKIDYDQDQVFLKNDGSGLLYESVLYARKSSMYAILSKKKHIILLLC